jgi:hypothetical protein
MFVVSYRGGAPAEWLLQLPWHFLYYCCAAAAAAAAAAI